MAHVDNVIFIPQVLKSFHILSVTILFIEHCTPLERLSQKAVNRLDDDPITRNKNSIDVLVQVTTPRIQAKGPRVLRAIL